MRRSKPSRRSQLTPPGETTTGVCFRSQLGASSALAHRESSTICFPNSASDVSWLSAHTLKGAAGGYQRQSVLLPKALAAVVVPSCERPESRSWSDRLTLWKIVMKVADLMPKRRASRCSMCILRRVSSLEPILAVCERSKAGYRLLLQWHPPTASTDGHVRHFAAREGVAERLVAVRKTAALQAAFRPWWNLLSFKSTAKEMKDGRDAQYGLTPRA